MSAPLARGGPGAVGGTLPAFDRRLAVAAVVALPAVAGLALGASLAFGGLAGWVAGLVGYWGFLGGALLAWGDRDWLAEWMEARWPGWPVAIVLALGPLGLGAATLRLLAETPPAPPVVILAALGAAINATLEELFWRGALIPDPTPRAAALALGLFTAAHLVWLAPQGLATGGPAFAPLAAALALGGAWTAARLVTGTVGAGVLSHAAFNLFAFLQVAALNA